MRQKNLRQYETGVRGDIAPETKKEILKAFWQKRDGEKEDHLYVSM
jgi:hypothetical protein